MTRPQHWNILIKIAAWVIVLGLVFQNLQLHYPELTVRSDPNDNIYHYALVDQATQLWEAVFSGKLSVFYLFDHYNERWNEGFALPNYYAHLPQAVIALFGFIPGLKTYDVFNLVKYLLLCLLPLSFFLSGRIMGFGYLYSVSLAVFSRLIITDGLYGIDISSFLWRGWGISAQLMSVFFVPLAIATTHQYVAKRTHLVSSIILNILVAQAHSGVFYMLVLTYPLLLVAYWDSAKQVVRRLFVLGVLVGVSMAYFFIPYFADSAYKNYSYWDSIWKFDSFGTKEILAWFLDGKMFDFGRHAVLTLLVTVGLFFGFGSKNRAVQWMGMSMALSMVFLFGRNGPLGQFIDIIPGLSEFHMHRFIVMVQIPGLYLAAWTATWAFRAIYRSSLRLEVLVPKISWATIVFLGFLSVGLYLWGLKPVNDYAEYNNKLISEGNVRYGREEEHYKALSSALHKGQRGRVYVGRPGNWGREFKVGDTPLYMALSRDGFAVIGFAPQSWSPNAEYDQFFDDTKPEIFDLYNVRYAVYPEEHEVPEFAKKLGTYGPYNLYSIDTGGWYTMGTSSTTFIGYKTHFYNMVKMWTGSTLFYGGEHPAIDLHDRSGARRTYNVRMRDLNNYDILFEDGSREENKNIWQDTPLYLAPVSLDTITWKKSKEHAGEQKYAATFTLSEDCETCVVILKQTYHPNWRIRVNGGRVDAFPVFPFYIGVPVEEEGTYTIEAVYTPSLLKRVLITLVVLVSIGYVINRKYKIRRLDRYNKMMSDTREKYEV